MFSSVCVLHRVRTAPHFSLERVTHTVWVCVCVWWLMTHTVWVCSAACACCTECEPLPTFCYGGWPILYEFVYEYADSYCMSMFSSVLDRVQLPFAKLYEFVYEYDDSYRSAAWLTDCNCHSSVLLASLQGCVIEMQCRATCAWRERALSRGGPGSGRWGHMQGCLIVCLLVGVVRVWAVTVSISASTLFFFQRKTFIIVPSIIAS
jgi:hypothetical protein